MIRLQIWGSRLRGSEQKTLLLWLRRWGVGMSLRIRSAVRLNLYLPLRVVLVQMLLVSLHMVGVQMKRLVLVMQTLLLLPLEVVMTRLLL